jgi:hypothetical protein
MGAAQIIRFSLRSVLMSKQNRANLIITRASKDSLHRRWVSSPKQQNFDLLVAAYDESVICGEELGSRYLYIPGHKLKGWTEIFRGDISLLDRYNSIAFIDDDIEAKTADLSRCFDIGTEFALKLWQPSLTWDSYVTYGGTLRNENFILRYVNFVEMMCPFFSSTFLREVLPIFGFGLESGVDLIWCSIAKEKVRSFAIVDEVSVKHTRPVAQQKHFNGFVDKNYESDIHACLDLFSTTWPSLVASSGVDKRGNFIEPQLSVTVRTLQQLFTILSAPHGHRKYRFKSVSDHIRHQLTRKPMYVADARSKLAKILRRGI